METGCNEQLEDVLKQIHLDTGSLDFIKPIHVTNQPVLYKDPATGIYFRQYQSEEDLQRIVPLVARDLSEPYSIYTYRYFIYNWPNLCLLAFSDSRDTTADECVGTIVCKMDSHTQNTMRGYIAMLAVKENYRRQGIGSRLVQLAVGLMIDNKCDEVTLETEITNKSALALYERLGFCRDKRLLRYYLNGVDAFRLKLWLTPKTWPTS
ncbi:acetyltransferase C complex catalytic subunit MAK3 [Fasciola hepatica]|uniref:Acetyltransferase C complex catalytic subunit MAK3 n=1 Tax=Fasciola hepatica TaxID=6192 RepID=A0A4E0RGH1_FASHE|nr:acetyltransferase C complex catalytic subunit MAK3 [Fasciola hepatica]